MPDKNELIGKQIGNYRVVRELNSGAFGSVYQAQHLFLKERTVAIKLLHAYLSSAKEREQFLQEAQFLEKLKHRYILSILDVGFTEGFPYLMAEYAAGGSLRERLKRQTPSPFTMEEAVSVLSQIGQALHYAHQQNIIHRDLKPENILFNAQGDALLADFGIATMLSTASIKHVTVIGGTPPYMAPEQFQGMICKESDQYALGCIAYELFTGRKPFAAPDFISMSFKHITERPRAPTELNPHLPVSIEQAILKAMAKQRTDRYVQVSSFISALQPTSLLPGNIPKVYASPSPTDQAYAPTIPAKTKVQWTKEGDTLIELKRYEEALAAIEQAIRLDPNNALAYDRKGSALNLLGRSKEAQQA
jgi:serine/threonine protein kinase